MSTSKPWCCCCSNTSRPFWGPFAPPTPTQAGCSRTQQAARNRRRSWVVGRAVRYRSTEEPPPPLPVGAAWRIRPTRVSHRRRPRRWWSHRWCAVGAGLNIDKISRRFGDSGHVTPMSLKGVGYHLLRLLVARGGGSVALLAMLRLLRRLRLLLVVRRETARKKLVGGDGGGE